MRNMLIGLVIGAIAGVLLAGYFKSDQSILTPTDPDLEVSVIQNTTDVNSQDGLDSASTQYTSINDILALPTEFAKTEALYALAGRATQAELKQLIQQSQKWDIHDDRLSALNIFITRLTILDPEAALETARNIMPGIHSPLEMTVWTTWGQEDLKAAVQIAKEANPAQKNMIAHVLYATVDDVDPVKLELIQSTLGVEPHLGILSRQLYALADKSVEAAEKFIEDLGNPEHKKNLKFILAQYNNQKDSVGFAVGNGVVSPYPISPSFTLPNMIGPTAGMLQTQPDADAAFEKYLSNPGNRDNEVRFFAALQSLVQTEPDTALAYLDKVPGRSNRSKIARRLISSLIVSDPQKALAWVRESNLVNDQAFLSEIYIVLARVDPLFAFNEASSIKNRTARRDVIGKVTRFAVRSSPENALKMLDRLEDEGDRKVVLAQLGGQWASIDFEKALEWVSALTSKDQEQAVKGMHEYLLQRNLDHAIVLVDKFPDVDSENTKTKIIQKLIENHSIDDALTFLERYQGTPEHERLLQIIMYTASYEDPDRAMQILKTFPDNQQKQNMYLTVVGQKAADDPQTALLWMESITDPAQRQQAITQVAMTWYSNDPDGARSWLENSPSGSERDDAIIYIIYMMQRNEEDPMTLIDSISDPAKLRRAKLQILPMMIYKDPDNARKLLSELDLTDSERAQYEQIFQAYKNGNIRIED